MNAEKGKKRWPIALAIIAAVVIASAAIIYSYRDAPGRIPITAVSSGSGDTLVAWKDSSGIYAQRLNASGQPLWEEDGVVIARTPPEKSYQWVSDGTGGAIFTWYDRPDEPLFYEPRTFYAQRIGKSGELLWGDGVAIGSGLNAPQVIPDSSGGAVFAWNGYIQFYKGLHQDILTLNKVDESGSLQWGSEGIIVATSTPYHELTEEDIAAGIKGTWTRSWPTYSGQFAAVYDDAGGVIVIWEDEVTTRTEAVYAQRYDERGEATWPEKVKVADSGLASAESSVTDEAIIKTTGDDRYSSGIGPVEVPQMVFLSAEGEILSSRPYDASAWYIDDGSGGFFKIWTERDPPSGPPWEGRTLLYVQREDANGKDLWPEILVVNPGKNEQITELESIADGKGGVIIAWRLSKDQAPLGGIMAQRIDANGELRWGEEGIPVFGSSRIRFQGIADVLGDGSGGATVIAAVGTGALSGDMVYAQKLDADGNHLWEEGIMINR